MAGAAPAHPVLPRGGQEGPDQKWPGVETTGNGCLSVQLSVNPSVHLSGVKSSQSLPHPPAWLPSHSSAGALIPVTYLSSQLSLNCFGSPSEASW